LATDWAHAAATGGGVLSQKQDGKEKVIEYWAKKLPSSAHNYPPKGDLTEIIHFIKH
jgi:hypothetical protein